MIIDSKSLLESIKSTKPVDEKCVRSTIHGFKQHLEEKKIRSVIHTRTHNMLADCLTKRGAPCEKLLEVLQTGNMINLEG